MWANHVKNMAGPKLNPGCVGKMCGVIDLGQDYNQEDRNACMLLYMQPAPFAPLHEL